MEPTYPQGRLADEKRPAGDPAPPALTAGAIRLGRPCALVLDAPALDWKAILEFNATQMGLPSFLALPVEWAIDARISPDWESLDALRHPEDFHLPILLFHGTEDKLVPISISDAFTAELLRWVTYYRVPRAGHTEAWNVYPALYERRLAVFLARIGVEQRGEAWGRR